MTRPAVSAAYRDRVEMVLRPFLPKLTLVRAIDETETLLHEAKGHLRAHRYRAAGCIAAVELERRLKRLVTQPPMVSSRRDPNLADYNRTAFDNGVIDQETSASISALAAIRKLCVHVLDREPSRGGAAPVRRRRARRPSIPEPGRGREALRLDRRHRIRSRWHRARGRVLSVTITLMKPLPRGKTILNVELHTPGVSFEGAPILAANVHGTVRVDNERLAVVELVGPSNGPPVVSLGISYSAASTVPAATSVTASASQDGASNRVSFSLGTIGPSIIAVARRQLSLRSATRIELSV